MSNMNIEIKDLGKYELNADANFIEALKSIDKNLLKENVAVKRDEKLFDMTSPVSNFLKENDQVELVGIESEEGLDILRHSTAHIMACAVKRIFNDVEIAIGPTIQNGFYYDFDIDTTFTPDDLKKIEKEMKKIIGQNLAFERQVISKDEAKKLFENEKYKLELIDDVEDEVVSIYRLGEFTDLCRGPHLPSSGKVKAYKLLNSAGAYWRGDEKNKMLQRIYGTSFSAKEALDEYLQMLKEAKKRDHRKLGKELELFSINEEVGPGLVLWHPKGGLVRTLIEDFWRKEHLKNGYDIVYTPHIAQNHLWHTSGHYGFYAENMYSTMEVDERQYQIKPMNCPYHMEIYNSKIHSYRDLPYRWAELGTVYRYERSGVLHGLMRVRGFTQDDAHIITTEEQFPEEVERTVRFCLHILNSFGFDKFVVYLSTKPEKAVGTDESWERATSTLKSVLEKVGLEYKLDPGEGVFYGPKIDIKIKDALNREWQCSTIQLDFNLPERFDMKYVDTNGNSVRPTMIHRALLGSIERFFGVMIEHYAGAFPVWLSPVQVSLLSITDRAVPFLEEVAKKLEENDIRVERDFRSEKLGFKIREARLKRTPFMVIAGDQEVEDRNVSLRTRWQEDIKGMDVDKLIQRVNKDIEKKS
ncbi:MAG: threonine--tRNA ligase [Pseudomonadota bacterium]